MSLRSPRFGLAALATAALLLAAAGSVFSQRGPIKIGLLVPLTGPLSANGKEMVNGLTLYLEEQKQQLAGREAKLIVEDTEGKPPIALNKARALAESHGVHVLVGPLATAEAYALVSYIERQKIPTLSPTVAGEDLTQRRRSSYVVRTGWSAGQPGHPFGKWTYETLKYRKIAMIGQDWAFGHESCGAFQRTFEEAGGQVVQKLWPPFGTTDFAPYITGLKRDVDAIYFAGAGNDALRFVRQYSDAGLKGRIPLIGSGNFTDEHILRSMGDEALGIVTALHYSAALTTPANRRFVKAYEAKHQQVPSYYAEGTYVAGSVLRAAFETIGGDAEDGAKFLAALRRVSITDAPRGPVSFDDYGHPIENIYVRRVERVEGKLQNTVIHTFPSVSQFGPYRAEDFLKNPVYSRDWPPCKAC
ncbi:MAG: ABC transporter substrate-binding protein [Candidatus Rokuibacteriota bacterium]|nr:MAG: ABC transporter substrate-binding protein [Candidatus Rokubacteria bacterium]